jgi:hypothetical protein
VPQEPGNYRLVFEISGLLLAFDDGRRMTGCGLFIASLDSCRAQDYDGAFSKKNRF